MVADGPAILADVAAELAEKDADREAMIRHILECEEQGYDMTAYKLDYGLITEEEAEAIEAAKAAEEAEKEEEARALRDRGMIRTDDVLKMTKEGLPTCNRECHLCMRKNCKFRKEC